MDEEARVRISWSEPKLWHSFAKMLTEKLGAVNLSMDALVEFQRQVAAFCSSRMAALGKLHTEGIVRWLRTLTESKSEIHLS